MFGFGTNNVHWNMGWLLTTCDEGAELFWPSRLDMGWRNWEPLPPSAAVGISAAQPWPSTLPKPFIPGFVNSARLVFGRGHFFIVWGYSTHYRMFTSISGLHPQDANNSSHTYVVTTRNVSRHRQHSMGGIFSLAEDHCFIPSPHMLSSCPPNCDPLTSLMWGRSHFQKLSKHKHSNILF